MAVKFFTETGLLALCSNPQPRGVPILVAFYDMHGLQWDYRKLKYMRFGWPKWYNVHIMFNENRLCVSKFIGVRDTFLRKASRLPK
jgi:hypothetical protein